MEPLSECLVFAMTLGMTGASSAQLWAAASADRAPFLHCPTPCLSPHAPVLELCVDWLEHGPWVSPIPNGWFIPMLGSLGVHWSSVRCTCVLSSFSHVQLFATSWTIACQAPLSVGFSRQGYWSGFPCPPPGDLNNPGIEPISLMSPALAGEFFTTSATWKAYIYAYAPPKLAAVGGKQRADPSSSPPTCCLAFSTSAVSLWIMRFSSLISSLVLRRFSPCCVTMTFISSHCRLEDRRKGPMTARWLQVLRCCHAESTHIFSWIVPPPALLCMDLHHSPSECMDAFSREGAAPVVLSARWGSLPSSSPWFGTRTQPLPGCGWRCHHTGP